MSTKWKITRLANEHCKTGENPVWDAARECVYWSDIPNGKLFRYDLATRSHEQIYAGPPVGGFALQTDGSLLLFRVNDVAVLPWRGQARAFIEHHDETMQRFNNVGADPEGRVFAGSIGATNENGGLYRADLDGTISKVCDGTGCANGSGFSPDLRTFYWTDSTNKRIFRFDYDRATGALSNRRLIHQVAEGDGIPDGMAVDAEGSLWSARWGGQAVVKHAPDGTVLEKIEMPVRTISSLCFGGRNLDVMFVTTAEGSPGSGTDDGALFQVEGPFAGADEFRSRIFPQRK